MIDRRQLVIGSALVPIAGHAQTGAPSQQAPASREADLARYIGFGIKASGGPGDNGCGAWIAGELTAAGYAVERQAIDIPYFDVRTSYLQVGDHRAEVVPQAIVVQTGLDGIEGPLVRVDPRLPVAVPKGCIAVVELPYRRWSTVTTPLIRDALLEAEQCGAIAALVITTGPTGGAVVLNAPADKPSVAIPVASLAPEDSIPVIAACVKGDRGRLIVDGRGGRRAAFNILGRLARGRNKSIIVSTPRSGWLTCAGERGPGIVSWLALARWAPRALPGVNLIFSCNSGHEYENAGSEALVRSHAPTPAEVALWLHLGAGFAARDWHESGGRLRPMGSVDPQRICAVTEAAQAAAREAFSGLPGLERPVVAADARQGETGTIIAAGYANTVGLLAAHRFHHHRNDDARCVDAGMIEPVIAGCKKLLLAAAR